jgi:DNA-binding CsgD family transcriptional regulator
MILDVFDHLSVGIVLLDQSAKVVFANAAALSLSADGGPLLVNSGVSSRSCADARRLGDLIRAAIAGSGARTMSLSSPDTGRPLLVLVSPVRGVEVDRTEIRNLRTTAAMLLVCDPDREANVPAGWMMDAYGLTLAEARAALATGSGVSIAETAQQLDVSANTVKTHLRRVYEKTGARRQADLSRLIATIGLARSGEARRHLP